MNALINLGKYMFAVPMAIFGAYHFMNADAMAAMVPVPGGIVWVYITGIALIMGAVALFLGKLDKLASVLLALILILFAVLVHLPNAIHNDPGALSMFLKDFSLSGAALMSARFAKDNSIIG